MMTSVSQTLGLNTPTTWTVVGVALGMVERVSHPRALPHPLLRFPTSVSPRIRGRVAREASVFRDFEIAVSLSHGGI